MEVLYTAQKAKSFFFATIGQIDACFTDLNQTIEGLATFIRDSNIQECQKDYGSILTSAGRFQKLLNEMMGQDFTPDVDPEILKNYRHDLRSAVSTIMGFSELIQESMVENNIPKAESFSYVLDQSRFLLTLIEKLKFEQKNQSFQESLDERQDYCSITYPGRILIIDDDPQKCQVLSRRLEHAGHQVFVCPNGQSGLIFLETESVDLILLDMLMPGMDGYEVLLALKKNDRTINIPVLIISSVSDMGNVVRCIRAGADDYLPMPVDTTLLHARINSCLTKKIFRDREQAALRQVEQTQSRLNAAIESIDEGFAIFNELDQLISCNKQFRNMYPAIELMGGLGFTYEEFLRKNVGSGHILLDRRASDQKSQEDWIHQYLSYHKSPGKPHAILLSSKKWVEVLENKTPEGGIVSVHKDISEGKRKEEQLEFLANHDPLTGLANRALFEEFLEKTLRESKNKNQKSAVIFYDLDGFKKVNDTLGHDFGDQVLNYVAIQLGHSVRENDLVARLGGDEFAAVLVNVHSTEDVEIVAKRCLTNVGTSLTLNGKTAEYGVSIGFSIYPEHGEDKDVLLKKADEAMYSAKKSGKGTYRIAV